eukprot:10429254-Alexandrium_andersonii.AAC.1
MGAVARRERLQELVPHHETRVYCGNKVFLSSSPVDGLLGYRFVACRWLQASDLGRGWLRLSAPHPSTSPAGFVAIIGL